MIVAYVAGPYSGMRSERATNTDRAAAIGLELAKRGIVPLVRAYIKALPIEGRINEEDARAARGELDSREWWFETLSDPCSAPEQKERR